MTKLAVMEISGKSFHFNLRFEQIGSRFWGKVTGFAYRFIAYLKHLPTRFGRLLSHLWKGLLFLNPGRQHWSERHLYRKIGNWYLDLILFITDIAGIPECYETLMDFVKFNSRSLTPWERELARSVFGDTIDYKRVRMDEYSITGPKQKRFCYVSFYIINSWGPMQNSTFIHEMTHIWQFENMGSIYIRKALQAQHSPMAYNYGGVEYLKDCREKGKSFLSFNLEQQGDIVSDYYRIRDGYTPQWGTASRMDLPVYESFIEELKNTRKGYFE